MRSLLVFLALITLWLAPPARAQEAAADTPRQVTIGMYINDIQAIDLASHSYAVDFYLWFRWSDPDWDATASFELMNTFDPEASVQTVLYDAPVPQPDGSFYQLVRHQGLFSVKFPLSKYPFDSQRILIAVEDAEEGAGDLQWVADEDGLTLNPEISLPGYRMGAPQLVIRDKPYPTAFGDLAEPDVTAYARAEFIVPISRPVISGTLKAFVPVFLIVLSAAFALLLDPAHVEARIGLAITALLTLVAMQFTMQSGLPEVAYLTLLDKIYLLSYLYVLAVIGVVVRGTRVDEQGAIQGGAGALSRLITSGPRTAVAMTGTYILAVIATVIVVIVS